MHHMVRGSDAWGEERVGAAERNCAHPQASRTRIA